VEMNPVLLDRHQVVVAEGAGSPAEVNLKEMDFVNTGLMREFKAATLLVADIDRGGMLASVIGTLELLSAEERRLLEGVVINRFRGNPSILQPGLGQYITCLEDGLDQVGVFGRKGITGERKRGEIGIMALRAGDVVGEHTVTFGTLGERIELVHKAHSRETFARGALRAARWVVNKRPGIYGMDQVLGLR